MIEPWTTSTFRRQRGGTRKQDGDGAAQSPGKDNQEKVVSKELSEENVSRREKHNVNAADM